jgi:hypothetical protein
VVRGHADLEAGLIGVASVAQEAARRDLLVGGVPADPGHERELPGPDGSESGARRSQGEAANRAPCGAELNAAGRAAYRFHEPPLAAHTLGRDLDEQEAVAVEVDPANVRVGAARLVLNVVILAPLGQRPEKALPTGV